MAESRLRLSKSFLYVEASSLSNFFQFLGISVLKGASMYREFALKLSEIIESAPGHLPLPHSRYVPEYLLDWGDRLGAGNQVTLAVEVIQQTLYLDWVE